MTLGPKQMGEAIIKNLKEKTGKSLEEWVQLILIHELTDKKEIMDFLKSDNRLGHFQALKIFEHHSGKDIYKDPDKLIDQFFDSERTRTLFDHVRSKVFEIGDDITLRPCLIYIPFYRNRQFAVLTKTKGDKIILGLNLPENHTGNGLLEPTSKLGGSERINAKTTIKGKNDLNAMLMDLITISYNNN
ncbi:DUF4287 domain-containing protein [Flagellimonas olearia]|uniref:DUF4287 domain-containing protein n=1 Tax=Flagellimonas olearia TaxID=552546 RepID=A0A6I1E983_9FLAO|nr:DUF5655 domain-containing protein [Allomuricauda olearia]KAB7530274.1 DUF4287 domain-containing protein [Allomuricauda olearia]